MQSTKLLLLSILSQAPIPYSQEAEAPEMELEVLALRPTFQVFVDEGLTQSLADHPFTVGQTGTLYIVVESMGSANYAFWQLPITGLDFPFGYDTPFGTLASSVTIGAEFEVTASLGETITMVLGGTTYTVASTVGGPSTPNNALLFEDGSNVITDESSTGSPVYLTQES